jgi:hypothetical protein
MTIKSIVSVLMDPEAYNIRRALYDFDFQSAFENA